MTLSYISINQAARPSGPGVLGRGDLWICLLLAAVWRLTLATGCDHVRLQHQQKRHLFTELFMCRHDRGYFIISTSLLEPSDASLEI